MASATISFTDSAVVLQARTMTTSERLGDWVEIEIEAIAASPVEPAGVLGARCNVAITNVGGTRELGGTVTSFTAIATNQSGESRVYRLVVRSTFSLLELRRDTRIFQQLSVPDIVKQVLEGVGISGSAVKENLGGSHSPREYVVQYAETDAAFIRRLCEEEGLYFRTTLEDGEECFHLEDTSTAADAAEGEPLMVSDASSEWHKAVTAFAPRVTLRRRVGKVTLRDYDQEKPALTLEGVATGGTDREKEDVEVYEAPGRFLDPKLGETRATQRLESLRADAEVWTFDTTAVLLKPGVIVELTPAPDLTGTARPEGEYFIVAVRNRFGGDGNLTTVEAIPRATVYRLPRITPRPRIHGIHSAWVTGAAGEEIHVDDQGRIRAKFHWDRGPATDDNSSLPIRVMQPNTTASMLLPRVGWEILVAFENGDPDRPYVLGRTYNAKQTPPYALPANKTVTALSTMSSPGAGRENQIRFDDAAGRQNISFAAGFGKNTTVANDMVTQTVKNEELTVKASQSRTVGANEDVAVTQGYLNGVGSQTATVGGMQKIYVTGDMNVGVGSETVVVGGACLEKVGNPVSGAINLAKAAALEGAGALGTAGSVISKAYTLGAAGYEGYQRGGLSGAAGAVAQSGLGMVADRLMPGGSTALGAITEAVPPPWAEPPAGGGNAAGGGAASASNTGGPAGPGPGHRNTSASGTATELVGGLVSMVSPGSIGWTTIGASTFLIGGSHNITAGQAGHRTLGASSETAASLTIKTSGDITRDITGAINTTIAGALSSKAGGKHSIEAGGPLSIKASGAIDFKATKVTFTVGGSSVTASPEGLLIESPTIKISGTTKQSKATGHL